MGYGAVSDMTRYRPHELAEALSTDVVEPSVLCGWSLGGLVAQAWAARCPSAVRGLVLVSTTPCFTSKADWPAGLAEEAVLDFINAFGRDPMATIKRFNALLAHGDRDAKHVIATLRGVSCDPEHCDMALLEQGLKILHESDLRDLVPDIHCPTLVMHGRNDQVCPVAAGEWLADAIPGAHLALHDEAAHAPFVTDEAWFVTALSDFLRAQDGL
jgi:pimeloyl-[acyl-carrier protein] methyl ester esterase